MHDLHLFGDLVIILTAALGVAWLFSRLKLPVVVGFLAAGIVLGPGATGLIADPHDIEMIAEIGIILLLFSIGLEISLEEIRRLALFVFGGGLLQFGFTTAGAGLAAWAFGYGPATAFFIGCLCGLSSTAIVLNELHARDEIESVHGRGMLGVLLFQDLAVVPLMLLVPLLAGTGQQTALWVVLLKAGGLVVGIWAVATYIFPWVAERIVETRRRELFTMLTIIVAAGTAYLSGVAGLSLALGAFMGGLVISETPYLHQMISEVEPFKHVFISLFFVSMGLLVKPNVVANHPWIVVGLVVAVFTIKALMAMFAIGVLGYSLRVAVLIGLGLAQVGEFSFILARVGLDAGLITDTEYGLFIVTAVITMAATPGILRWSGGAADIAAKLRSWVGFGEEDALPTEGEAADVEGVHEALEDHVIIVGYGTNGRRMARALRSLEVPYVITELNPNTVREFGDKQPIVYGDATQQPILKKLGVTDARALVITAGDQTTVRQIVTATRQLNSEVEVVARIRYLTQVPALRRDGAQRIVIDELETSRELLSQTLQAYGLPSVEILKESALFREESARLESGELETDQAGQFDHPSLAQLGGAFDSDVLDVPETVTTRPTTFESLTLFDNLDITTVGIVRNETVIANPEDDFELEFGDQLVVVGPHSDIRKARERCVEERASSGGS